MEATLPTVSVTQAGPERVARSYALRDAAAVLTFLHDHPEVVPPLLDAVEVVPRFFGPGTTLALEVYRDPEARDDRELFALIVTPLVVAPALERLQRFEDEWWLRVLPTANRKLMFGLEYR